MIEISTPKTELALALADYSRKEQRQILKAARHLQSYMDLTSDELSEEEAVDKEIKDLEEEEQDAENF